jgi:flagellar protein FlgJ
MAEGISLNVAAPTAFGAAGKSADTAKLKDAAGKFEAMLIAQMLKSARKTDSGGWSGESDQSSSSLMEMGEQQLADMLGAQGGLGIAKMVVTQLGPKT